jgi:predicted component of type VI protein secretion system
VKTFSIGRDKACDVKMEDRSVSSRHAELVITTSNEIHLTDCASTNGTFVLREGQWQRLRQDFVKMEERVLFGRYEIGVNQLVHMAQTGPGGPPPAPGPKEPLDHVIKGAVQRDEFGRPVGKT